MDNPPTTDHESRPRPICLPRVNMGGDIGRDYNHTPGGAQRTFCIDTPRDGDIISITRVIMVCQKQRLRLPMTPVDSGSKL